jgi:hypothetical protein
MPFAACFGEYAPDLFSVMTSVRKDRATSSDGTRLSRGITASVAFTVRCRRLKSPTAATRRRRTRFRPCCGTVVRSRIPRNTWRRAPNATVATNSDATALSSTSIRSPIFCSLANSGSTARVHARELARMGDEHGLGVCFPRDTHSARARPKQNAAVRIAAMVRRGTLAHGGSLEDLAAHDDEHATRDVGLSQHSRNEREKLGVRQFSPVVVCQQRGPPIQTIVQASADASQRTSGADHIKRRSGGQLYARLVGDQRGAQRGDNALAPEDFDEPLCTHPSRISSHDRRAADSEARAHRCTQPASTRACRRSLPLAWTH